MDLKIKIYIFQVAELLQSLLMLTKTVVSVQRHHICATYHQTTDSLQRAASKQKKQSSLPHVEETVNVSQLD